MRPDAPRGPVELGPTLRWGLGIGVLVAAIDALSLAVSVTLLGGGEAAQYVALADQIANVMLFSLAGLRVGRQTRLARAAAEAGVLAGVIAGAPANVVALAVPEGAASTLTAREMVGTLALNVAMGGLLALLNGWIASRAAASPRGR